MRTGSKHPKDESSGVVPPPPTSTGDTLAKAYVDLATAIVPTPSTSEDFDIRRTLKTIMTVQATHGQLLVDLLDKIHALRVDLEHFR